jgi:hypothetical protein
MSTRKNTATELQAIKKRTSGRLSLVNCAEQSKDKESIEKKEVIEENQVENEKIKNDPNKGELFRSNSVKKKTTTRESLAIVANSSSPQTSVNETNSSSLVKGRVFF